MQTGVNYTVLARLLKGEVPSAAAVIRWAVSLGSDPNQWLKLAGHDLLPEGPQGKIALVGAVQRGEPSLTFTQPEPPELVRTMIERATTREDKIAVAFNYLASLPDVRLGADTGSANARQGFGNGGGYSARNQCGRFSTSTLPENMGRVSPSPSVTHTA